MKSTWRAGSHSSDSLGMRVVSNYFTDFSFSFQTDFCSDVTDVAWSPEDRFVASTGLDSKVFIWCGFTLGTMTHLHLQRVHDNSVIHVYLKNASQSSTCTKGL